MEIIGAYELTSSTKFRLIQDQNNQGMGKMITDYHIKLFPTEWDHYIRKEHHKLPPTWRRARHYKFMKKNKMVIQPRRRSYR